MSDWLAVILSGLRSHMEYMRGEGMEYKAALGYGRFLSETYDLPNTGLMDGIVMNVWASDLEEDE